MQQQEIQGSKAALENILGHPVMSFAYPHGSCSAETAAIVKQAGFSIACTSQPDVVWPSSNRYRLPRVCVRDWDGDAFARHLDAWLAG